jgi:hypothetical protein
MKRSTALLSSLLLIALGWNAALFVASRAQAAPVPARQTYLPAVAGGSIVAQTKMVYACQCGWVALSVRGNGSLYLTILDHSRGGKVVVGTYDGVTFKELPNALPGLPDEGIPITPGPAPAYEYPGLKQGPGMTVDAWGKMVTCAPNRTEPEGQYDIWCAVSEQP